MTPSCEARGEQCPQERTGDGSEESGGRELSDLSQEQGNSDYYEGKDGVVVRSFLPKETDQCDGNEKCGGFGHSGQRFCRLWLAGRWSQLCAAWQRGLMETDRRLCLGDDMKGFLKQGFVSGHKLRRGLC